MSLPCTQMDSEAWSIPLRQPQSTERSFERWFSYLAWMHQHFPILKKFSLAWECGLGSAGKRNVCVDWVWSTVRHVCAVWMWITPPSACFVSGDASKGRCVTVAVCAGLLWSQGLGSDGWWVTHSCGTRETRCAEQLKCFK